MGRVWKRRLPALLLALAVTITLAPMALAEEGQPHDHVFQQRLDETNHWQECDICHEKRDEQPHSFDAGEVTKDPSCYEAGVLTRTCTGCAFTTTEKINETDHVWDTSRWESDKAQHWRVCIHYGTGCSGRQEPENHNWSDKVLREATCTEAGKRERTCRVCGFRYTEDIEKIAHVDQNRDNLCDVCGAKVVTNVTVTFKTGSDPVTQTVALGEKPQKPAVPSMSGTNRTYTFKGWTTSSTSSYVYTGQALTTVENTPVSADVTYYALYTVRATGRNVSVTLDSTDAIRGGDATSESASLRSQMNSSLSGVTGAAMTRARFGSDAGTSYGKLYTNSKKTALSTSKDYYYSSSSYGSYPLSDVYFVPTGVRGTYSISYTAADEYGNTAEGTASFVVGAAAGKISYSVTAGNEVAFKPSDFNRVYQSSYSETVRWVTFSTSSSLSTSNGTVYYDYGGRNEKAFTKSTLDDDKYYYSSSSYGDYDLGRLSFAAPASASDRTVTLSFRAYYSSKKYVDGVVEIKVNAVNTGKIAYTAAPGEAVPFDAADFNKAYREVYSETIRWVTFSTSSTLNESNGAVYYRYGTKNEKSFTKSSIDDYQFYYNSSTYGNYALDDLSFVAGSVFDTTVTLSFRAYYSSSRYVDGTLTIKPAAITSADEGDIRYYAAYDGTVQINPNDIARYFHDRYPSYALQYVTLNGVPAAGSLYYNFYNSSSYGASKLKLTTSNCDDHPLYFSPSSSGQYALSELTYVPSGVNYCAAIPFTAYSSSSRSVSGKILISVNRTAVQEVYRVTTKGSSVSLPDDDLYEAVTDATGTSFSSIRFLSLPAASVGTVYVGSGTGTKADTTTKYTHATGSRRMDQLRFAPAGGFTGSVELPYVAYNSSGTAVASGKFCIGVVSRVAKYTDLPSSNWSYRYVTELSDDGVIDGYTDGSYRPNGTVTYGQALKLILLAAGYSEQRPTGTHWASGYLAKARAAGILSGDVNLDAQINRLAVAQIAAKAMELSTSGLSSVKPFTDTSDASVQALYEAGIVEGFFSSGANAYKPYNTLTRAQIATIVWRMEQAG